MFLLFLPVREALAATQYVSDQITVLLRRGPGTEYKILKNMQTGTRMEVLEEGEEYFFVRLDDGTEGYVLRQYLSADLPKTVVIARLNQEKDRLKSRIEELKAGAGGWVKEKEELERQLADVQQAFQGEKSKRLAVAKNYQDLQEGAKNVTDLLGERDKLKAENEQQAAELKKLRQENDKILRTALFRWFLAGAGVLFAGWIMGKQSRTKRRGF
jgi:SH3 domain protein